MKERRKEGRKEESEGGEKEGGRKVNDFGAEIYFTSQRKTWYYSSGPFGKPEVTKV
jgi:hypothetical protein